MSNGNSRIARNAEQLVFYTDTDEQREYPIYITPSREIWHKKKPSEVIATLIVNVSPLLNEFYGSMYYTKAIKSVDDLKSVLGATPIVSAVSEPGLERIVKAVEAALSLSSAEVVMRPMEIKYEVYVGDHERLLGSAIAYDVKIMMISKFSCVSEKQAWAISFEWEKRLKAKYPEISDYVYAKPWMPKRMYARAIIKIPVVTPEFERLFNQVLASSAAQVSQIADLESQVRQLEEIIKQKEQELQALREQYQQLLMKLQLEKMKSQVV